MNGVVSGGPHFHFHVPPEDLEVVSISVLEVLSWKTFEEDAEDDDASDKNADKYDAGHQSVIRVHLIN